MDTPHATTTRYRLGVDTGGTFTDATLIDESTGRVAIAKVPSTPADPALGFLDAVERILREQQVAPAQVGYVVHGTTVATNAVIEGKWTLSVRFSVRIRITSGPCFNVIEYR